MAVSFAFIARAWLIIAVLNVHLFWWLITLLPVYAIRLYNISLSRQIEAVLYGWVTQLYLYVIEYGNYKFRFTGSGAPGMNATNGADATALLVSNHISDADPFMILQLAFRYGHNVNGKLKYFMKSVLKYIFPAGPLMAGHESIFLSRSFEKDGPMIEAQLQSFVDHKPSAFWIAIFPEGTYVTPYRMNLVTAGHEFAKKNGLPVLHNVMTPRTKGLVVTMDKLKGEIEAVYDVTMALDAPFGVRLGEKMPPTLLASLTNTVHQVNTPAGQVPTTSGPVTVHMHVERIPKADLPATGKVSDWTHALFLKKEKLLDQFIAEGKFPGDAAPEVKTEWPIKLAQSIAPPAITAYFMLSWLVSWMGGYREAAPLFVKVFLVYAVACLGIAAFLSRAGMKKKAAAATSHGHAAPAPAAADAPTGDAAHTKKMASSSSKLLGRDLYRSLYRSCREFDRYTEYRAGLVTAPTPHRESTKTGGSGTGDAAGLTPAATFNSQIDSVVRRIKMFAIGGGAGYYRPPLPAVDRSFVSILRRFRNPASNDVELPAPHDRSQRAVAFKVLRELNDARHAIQTFPAKRVPPPSAAVTATATASTRLLKPVTVPRVGCLLISHPRISVDDGDEPSTGPNPYWSQSVLLITKYDAKVGTQALILNKPTRDVRVKHPLWARNTAFVGGPVDVETLAILHPQSSLAGAQPVVPGVYLDGDKADLMTSIRDGFVSPLSCKLLSGRAEWISGQLEAELDRGWWFVASPHEYFSAANSTATAVAASTGTSASAAVPLSSLVPGATSHSIPPPPQLALSNSSPATDPYQLIQSFSLSAPAVPVSLLRHKIESGTAEAVEMADLMHVYSRTVWNHALHALGGEYAKYAALGDRSIPHLSPPADAKSDAKPKASANAPIIVIADPPKPAA